MHIVHKVTLRSSKSPDFLNTSTLYWLPTSRVDFIWYILKCHTWLLQIIYLS